VLDIPFVVRYRTMNGMASADFLRGHQYWSIGKTRGWRSEALSVMSDEFNASDL